MIETIAENLSNCPQCGQPITFIENANDWGVPNTKYSCSQCGLVVAFPNERIYQRHRELLNSLKG